MTPTAAAPNRIRKSYRSARQRWEAVAGRDQRADNTFFYAVKTTGVYCRPSCGARLARRENVEFYLTCADAERAGFRACKRCRPGELSANGRQTAAIARACRLIVAAQSPLSLQTLTGEIGMSPSHFHRLFKSMTGLSPKAYAMAHRSQRIRDGLSRNRTITSAIYNAGFNSSARFYANSTRVLGMKPTDFKIGGEGATIRFAVGECSLGSILVAASDLGICAISLGDDPQLLVRQLQDRFPKAELIGGDKPFEQWVAQVIAFVERPAAGLNLPLHVQGTAFQHRVWKKLCEIPSGKTSSYLKIARELGDPNATRAVARACAANRVALAIPCHRVIRGTGETGGYRWGLARKQALLDRERAAR